MFSVFFYVLCTIVLIPCLLIVYRSQFRNNGLIATIIMVGICNLLCIVTVISRTPKTVLFSFYLYYIVHAWMFFSVAIFAKKLLGYGKVNVFKIFSLYSAVLQTVLMLFAAIVGGVYKVERHILLGRNWWVLSTRHAALESPVSMAFSLIYAISILYIAGLFLSYIRKTAKIYRSRIYFLFIAQVLYLVIEVYAAYLNMPIWLISIIFTPVCMLSTYFTVAYTDSVLTRNVLYNFADVLAGGFVLYDDRDRLVYINKRIEQLLPETVKSSFQTKSGFDGWKMSQEDFEGLRVKRIDMGNVALYFKIFEHRLEDEAAYIGTFYNLEDTTDSVNTITAMDEANEALERAAKMKSDFLANMSHEIRTPMNAVIGMAEMALREDLPAQAKDYVNQIKTSGTGLLNIINDILDFSKIESGKMDIIPEVYEPVSEYHNIGNTLMTRIGEKDIELIVDVDPTIPFKLEGDSMRIRQVIINLANNAIKFTKSGFVRIKITYEKVSYEQIMLTCHVIDTGMGIKAEDLESIFVSFQQVDSKRNRGIEGTGLGLAISKSLIASMGGKIGVTSEYGVGSDFYFTIPQKVADIQPSMTVEKAGEVFAVGIVYDEVLGEFFERNMEQLGVEYAVVSSADWADGTLESIVTGTEKRCFVFFESKDYDARLRNFLDRFEVLEGVILVNFDSFFTPEQKNLRMVRRPLSTLAFSLVLNDKRMSFDGSEDDFEFDFVAPDARVLIVDDNPTNLMVARGLLEPLGMTIETAMSGKQAIELVSQYDYDIIFMDHMMPEMDGIETAQYIRNHFPNTDNTPIIALTANAVSGAKEMFLSSGMNDFVPKPVEVKNITAKVRRWLPNEKLVKRTAQESSVVSEESISIEGIDTEAAIKLIGSVALYKKVAQDYYKNIDGMYADIFSAYESGDWENYTIKVHALKSASRQIGAMDLAVLAEKLEAAGHESDIEYIKGNTDELLEQYRVVQQLLAVPFGEVEEQTELVDFDSDVLMDRLVELKNGCDELDMDVMEQIGEELKKYNYSEEQKKLVDRLLEAIGMIDVDTCNEVADELMSLI